VQKKFAGLLAAYEARGTAVSCIEKELAVHPPQRADRNTLAVFITGAFKPGIPPLVLQIYGLEVRDKIIITLDLVEEGMHPHRWVNVLDTIAESEKFHEARDMHDRDGQESKFPTL
jgi:hypothetical protein